MDPQIIALTLTAELLMALRLPAFKAWAIERIERVLA